MYDLTSSDEELGSILARNIRRVRKLRFLSQKQVAEAIGVTFQQVQKYEKGKNQISVIKLLRLAQFLDCSLEDLLEINKQSNKRDTLDEFAILAKHYDAIKSPEIKRSLIALARTAANSRKQS